MEAIERRYDEGRSLLTAHQLCVFTALLMDMRSPFCAKWLRHTLGYMGSCRWGQQGPRQCRGRRGRNPAMAWHSSVRSVAYRQYLQPGGLTMPCFLVEVACTER